VLTMRHPFWMGPAGALGGQTRAGKTKGILAQIA